MIIRLNGGKHVQVVQQWDRNEKKTFYRARLTDSFGRSLSDFCPWYDNFDDAVNAAKVMLVKDKPWIKREEVQNG